MPLDRKTDKWIVLAITCLGALMGPLDATIVSVSLPTITQSLQMDYATSVWVPTAYLVTLASLLLTVGRWSDLKGPQAPVHPGIRCLRSWARSSAASPQDGVQLIVFRIVQGVGAAFIMATSTAIITAAFPPQERGKALGINADVGLYRPHPGPPLGALPDRDAWAGIRYSG